MTSIDDLERWRAEFPILEQTVYMISNSLGAMPRGAADSLAAYADAWATRGVRAWEERWWEMAREIGDSVGRIIGAAPGSVSMHENVTTAAMVALSCDRTHGRRASGSCVLRRISRQRFISIARSSAAGFELTVVPAEPDFTMCARARDRGDRRADRARVLLARAVQDLLHHGRPADRRARARGRGALVMLDGYQSAGIIPVDVAALGVDFFVGGCLKWLCGGPGTAFLYRRRRHATAPAPRFTGWFSHRAPFAFDIDRCRSA